MCRFAAWIGKPTPLSSLVCEPNHGLIAQARHSREALMDQHPDGAGVLWYRDTTGTASPERYLNASPAWCCPELEQVARDTTSPLFLAHVRAATRAARCLQNCHPFRHGQMAFMHNGELAQIDTLAPALRKLCADDAPCKNATDSELFFCLLRRYGVETSPERALSDAIRVVRDTAHEANVDYKLRLSAVFSDGSGLRVVRYASDDKPPTLYQRRCGAGLAFASEPIGNNPEQWKALPVNSVTTATPDGVETKPVAL